MTFTPRDATPSAGWRVTLKVPWSLGRSSPPKRTKLLARPSLFRRLKTRSEDPNRQLKVVTIVAIALPVGQR